MKKLLVVTLSLGIMTGIKAAEQAPTPPVVPEPTADITFPPHPGFLEPAGKMTNLPTPAAEPAAPVKSNPPGAALLNAQTGRLKHLTNVTKNPVIVGIVDPKTGGAKQDLTPSEQALLQERQAHEDKNAHMQAKVEKLQQKLVTAGFGQGHTPGIESTLSCHGGAQLQSMPLVNRFVLSTCGHNIDFTKVDKVALLKTLQEALQDSDEKNIPE